MNGVTVSISKCCDVGVISAAQESFLIHQNTFVIKSLHILCVKPALPPHHKLNLAIQTIYWNSALPAFSEGSAGDTRESLLL